MILSEPPARHPFTASKVVLLSGLADPATCALSPIQRRFLDAIDAPAESKVYWNFPYVPSTRPRAHPPLWLASIRNYAQFLRASKPAYRDRARVHWRALLESTESLVVITGSCGLEILNHCVEDGDDCVDGGSAGRIAHVFALGPVARARPNAPHTIVQGTRDPITKLYFRSGDVALPGVGHMKYLEDSRALELVNTFLCNSTSRFSAPASISRSAG
jgi:hypothetical protein